MFHANIRRVSRKYITNNLFPFVFHRIPTTPLRPLATTTTASKSFPSVTQGSEGPHPNTPNTVEAHSDGSTNNYPEILFRISKPLEDKGAEKVDVVSIVSSIRRSLDKSRDRDIITFSTFRFLISSQKEGFVVLDTIKLYKLVEDLGMSDLQMKLAPDETSRVLLPNLSMLVNYPRDKMNALFPDPISRNRIKVYLREVTNSPLASDSTPVLVPTISSTQVSFLKHYHSVIVAKQAWIRTLNLPEILANTETGFVTQWCVEPLDDFAGGTTICKVETTVGTVDLHSPEEGYVSERLLELNHEVPVNTPVAVLVHMRHDEKSIEFAAKQLEQQQQEEFRREREKQEKEEKERLRKEKEENERKEKEEKEKREKEEKEKREKEEKEKREKEEKEKNETKEKEKEQEKKITTEKE